MKCDIENRKYKKRSWGKQEKRRDGGCDGGQREGENKIKDSYRTAKLRSCLEIRKQAFLFSVKKSWGYSTVTSLCCFFWQILFYWASLKEPSCWLFLREYFLWHQRSWEMKSALNWWTETLTCPCMYLCVWESLCEWVLQFALDTH